MGKRLSVRDTAGKFREHAAVFITKELEKEAEEVGVNVRRVVADKLEESYKRNLELSYTPRSAEGWETMMHNEDPYTTHKRKLTYKHTNTLKDKGVYVDITDDLVAVKIKEVQYDDGKKNPRTTIDVYNYLTKGTQATGENYAYKAKDGTISGGNNYPTEIHRFEDWTRVEMRGFIDSLKGNLKNYTSYRYTGKKKKRTHYKGVDIREGGKP